MKTIVLATSNAGKVREFQGLLQPAGFAILTPRDLGFTGEIRESGESFAANSLIKAQALSPFGPWPVLADDSGLEVTALGGAPGIHTARYAGPGCMDADNRAKLLRDMEGKSDRRARFVCVLCYLEKGEDPRFYEGTCEGRISLEERGESGFGYDSLFIPEGLSGTFAELSDAYKDRISHRGKSIQSFLATMG